MKVKKKKRMKENVWEQITQALEEADRLGLLEKVKQICIFKNRDSEAKWLTADGRVNSKKLEKIKYQVYISRMSNAGIQTFIVNNKTLKFEVIISAISFERIKGQCFALHDFMNHNVIKDALKKLKENERKKL